MRARELKETFRLIGECRELGADAFLWRRHLLGGLGRLFGDFVGVIAAGHRTPPARSLETTLVVDRGWPCDASRNRWLEYMQCIGPNADPNMNAFLARFVPPHLTAVRKELVDDAEHYGSDYYRDCLSPLHIDDSLCSFHETGDGSFDCVTLHRRSGDPHWTARDLGLLDLLHVEIAQMIGRELANGDRAWAPMGRRVEETLEAMLDGLSEKEIAGRIGISEHTVHQYVKVLFRRYRVRSRPELMALWVRRHRLARPRPQ